MMDSYEQEKEDDGPFISYTKDQIRKLVDNGKIDTVGLEQPGAAFGAIDSLDLMGLKEKNITDRLPLLALMDKVRDIAYYLPIIKNISNK